MTDKQLAVLLFHLCRQINEMTSLVERELVDSGAFRDATNHVAVIQLRALAEVLQEQARDLNRATP